MPPGYTVISCLAALSLVAPVLAEEGGSSRYVPGNTSTLIDLPPTKEGWALESMYLHYDGDVSASRELTQAGLVVAGIDASSDAFTLGGFYTFGEKIADSWFTMGAFAPYVWMDVEANVTAGGLTGNRRDTNDGFGDITLIPAMMAWKVGALQYGAFLPIYAPTGEYDTGNLANPGRNYWTFDPTFQVSYSNASLFNALLFSGFSFNTENNATDYHSGTAFHVDAAVQQMFKVGPGFLTLGASGFWYEQIQGDSGSGAKLGDLKGRSLGIGPALGYILPVGENTFVADVSWLPEIETRRRVEGDFIWLKAAYQF